MAEHEAAQDGDRPVVAAIYTALTRQKEKVVLLHQGDIRDLLRFSDASESEVARRCTNLFEAPRMVAVEERFLEDRLIHRTARGKRVRSKSEVRRVFLV